VIVGAFEGGLRVKLALLGCVLATAASALLLAAPQRAGASTPVCWYNPLNGQAHCTSVPLKPISLEETQHCVTTLGAASGCGGKRCTYWPTDGSQLYCSYLLGFILDFYDP
jgi:hypothetical protein